MDNWNTMLASRVASHSISDDIINRWKFDLKRKVTNAMK